MARRGARVTGIDISSRMIEHARRIESDEPLGVDYLVGDAADLQAPPAGEPFDVATSCVALQDMPDVGRVFRAVRSVLRPGGRFVASITHPCSDTPFRRWERDLVGRKRWLCIDRYFDEGPVSFVWERWIDWILAAGFEIRALREPRPTEQAIRARPDLEDAGRVPYYVMFDLGNSARQS
jgi:SAM-dependent methyltransferase